MFCLTQSNVYIIDRNWNTEVSVNVSIEDHKLKDLVSSQDIRIRIYLLARRNLL